MTGPDTFQYSGLFSYSDPLPYQDIETMKYLSLAALGRAIS